MHKLAALILGPVAVPGAAYLDVKRYRLPGWAAGPTSSMLDLLPWFCIVALLGYGRRFLCSGGRVLKYAATASYPGLPAAPDRDRGPRLRGLKAGLGVPLSFTAILVGSFMVCLMGYELIRRTNLLRFPFGMKIVRRSRPVLSGEDRPQRVPAAGVAAAPNSMASSEPGAALRA